MMIGVQGSREFSDYSIFLRAMGTALSTMRNNGEKEFLVYTAGPAKINEMVQEFMNVNERSLKAYGIKSKFIKVPTSWIKQNIRSFDSFIFFCKPKEIISPLVKEADDHDVDASIYRY